MAGVGQGIGENEPKFEFEAVDASPIPPRPRKYRGGCMFEEVSESLAQKLKRRTVFLSILGLGIAIVELIEFFYTHKVDHGILSVVWLAVAVGWAYRFRHFGEPQSTKLNIEARTQD